MNYFNAEIPLFTENQTIIKYDFNMNYTHSLFFFFYELHGFTIIPKRYYTVAIYVLAVVGKWVERKVVTECAFELSTHVIENRNLNLTLGSQSFYRSYDK